MERPRIVCLCGSTRFYEAFQRANYEETMAGRIVLSVGHYPNAPDDAHCEKLGCTPEEKAKLDELHKRKIDLADEVLVLNPLCRVCPKCGSVWRHDRIRVEVCGCGHDISGIPPAGYVGESTRSEVEYAKKLGRPIRWLEPVGGAS